MSKIKRLEFIDGVTVTEPTDLSLEASTNNLEVYANDAAFVAANGTATSGDAYINSTTNTVKVYSGAAWREMAELTSTQTLTNKTISGSSNTLTVLAATQLSGATPIANGGTGQTSQTDGFDALAPTTTKGDIIVHNGTDNIRVAVGSNNQILMADSAQTSGVKWATSTATQSGSLEIKNLTIAASVAASALTLAIKTAAVADATAGDPVSISFRNSTEATGTYNVRTITAALSMTVPSGATFGQITGGSSWPLYVYALDNSGTVELAISGKLYDESKVQTTVALSGSSTSGSVLYSTTLRSNVPIRLIGRIAHGQATPGTWSAVPTEIALTPLGKRTSHIYAYTGNGVGGSSSGDTKTRNFSNTSITGTGIGYASRSATQADYFYIRDAGVYMMAHTDKGSAQGNFGITVNGAASTAVSSQTPTTRLANNIFTAGYPNHVTAMAVLYPGDIIRCQNDGSTTSNDTSDQVTFQISKVADA